MIPLKLLNLVIYPIQGMQGNSPQQANIQNRQLLYNNTLGILKADGTPLDLKQQLDLIKLTCFQDEKKTILYGINGETISFETKVMENCALAPFPINRWLSMQLKEPVQLFQYIVPTHPNIALCPLDPLSYRTPQTEYYLLNLASFPEKTAQYLLKYQHPHFLINYPPADIEHTWNYLKIGSVIFQVIPAIFPTMKYCKLYPVSDGTIKKNDCVTPLLITDFAQTNANKVNTSQTITIQLNEFTFLGNTQQILLEQLENQGFAIPFSCRAGICGKCHLKLLQGEILPLVKQALNHTQILSCSTIPLTNIKIQCDM